MKRFAGCAAFVITVHILLASHIIYPALAAKCAAASVTAKGEESSYEWLAKTKARANWRRKVRSLPDLGAAYADWGKATNTEEKCLSGPAGSVCTFTGTPCGP